MPKQYDLPGFLRNSDLPDTSDSDSRPTKKAAVLIPLLRKDEDWHVLFIRRSHRDGDRHSGQVAFPGGKHEADDASIRHTALREAEEEIGLDQRRVEVLGELSPYLTISDYRIHPFVSIIPWPLDLTAQDSEVARIFSMPLAWLRDEDNYYLKIPENRASLPARVPRRTPAVYYNTYDGELLWGATARMTLTLLKALDDGQIRID